MNKTEQNAQASNTEADQTTKKIYTPPSIKLYGSINDLVQGHPTAGKDGSSSDDVTGGS
jgi:hypothetical protein